jgi:SAM-dependent methyltransferase
VKIERDARSSASLNELEHEWWNEHAGTVARVWEMDDAVSRAARASYLRRIKRFLQAPRGEARILELGCGSGWVGQALAGPRLRIVGTDFSENQIALAKRNAAARRVAPYCSYYVAGANDWPRHAEGVNGVLVHAFLHHLDDTEIDGILDALEDRLPAGAKVLCYEPAFHATRAGGGPSRSRRAGVALRAAARLHAGLSRLYAGAGLLDGAAVQRFTALQEKASAEGWYLSPKEVPFDVDAFTERLARRFDVRDSYWATVYTIGWAFETNMLSSPLLRRIGASSVVPLFALADRWIARDEPYLRSVLSPPAHAFRIWECAKH